MTETIWRAFNQQLLGFIKARVNSKETAEDILQEVFIKIHKGVHKLNDNSKIESWIYQITRNSIIDHYRKRKLNTQELNFDISLPEEIDANTLDFTECLKPFIRQLPEKYQDILWKTTYGNQPQKEYAISNDLTYSMAKSRMQRARKQLNQLFNQCCAIEADRYGNIIAAKEKDCSC
ncbi:sigma-70 family RNA polymerase sigma factor [Flagellimonas algicola]|uniref:Sigma-70 family RNA polymerase sigma factor n=1 Tax=Flagellimonas algicola TaxID=2583815 RepID=A0ABY2WIV8_9FLAO|nr:sigma-70 family RNA polymerase sigma factor [Allomuricauda algicola]TMU54472.1 sigma-70 family RNA polymerase sigma factor [Allomuricauda algicola]